MIVSSASSGEWTFQYCHHESDKETMSYNAIPLTTLYIDVPYLDKFVQTTSDNSVIILPTPIDTVYLFGMGSNTSNGHRPFLTRQPKQKKNSVVTFVWMWAFDNYLHAYPISWRPYREQRQSNTRSWSWIWLVWQQLEGKDQYQWSEWLLTILIRFILPFQGVNELAGR